MKSKSRLIITFLLIGFLSILALFLQIGFKTLGLEEHSENIFIRIQHESMPLDFKKEQFENVLEQFSNIKSSTYYEIYAQALGINEELLKNPLFSDILDLNHQLPSVQIGKNVSSDFHINLLSGRFFEEEDFIFDGTSEIPVILGNAYKDIWNINTCFEGQYLFDTYPFRVIGILEEKSEINISLKNYELDDCILMPSFEISDGVVWTNGLSIHYANKTSGIIKTQSETKWDTQKYISEIINNSEVGEYSQYSTSAKINFKQMFGIKVEQFITISLLLLFTIVIFYTRLLCRTVDFKSNLLFQLLIYSMIFILQCFVVRIAIYIIGFRLSVFFSMFFVLLIIVSMNTFALVKIKLSDKNVNENTTTEKNERSK